MKIIVLNNLYAIYRFSKNSRLPDWIYSSDFYSVTSTVDEISVVAIQIDDQTGILKSEPGYRLLKVAGPLDLSLTGIIAQITSILSAKKVPVFVVSTYETDYILVKQEMTALAIEALKKNDIEIIV
jgi:uncharacterized protein